MSKTVVIVNPNSALGTTASRIPALSELLTRRIGEHETWKTERIGDGIRLGKQAAEGGATRVICVGGDGTSGEIVSGLLESDRRDEVSLGLLPLGTGGDFARMLWRRRDLESAVERIAVGRSRLIDAAQVRYQNAEGQRCQRGFLNILSCGMSAFSVMWIQNQVNVGKRGRTTYIRSGLVGLCRYRQSEVSIHVDGELVHDGPLVMAAFANGQYFGGGMKIAPDSEIDDGLLDVIIVPGTSRTRLLFQFPTMMNGSHVRSKGAIVRRGRNISVSGRIWLEADGEPIGRVPAEIEVLPGAIRLLD